MDEETIKKAGLIAAVLCRILDYHTASSATLSSISANGGKLTKAQETVLIDSMTTAERSVAVAIENAIDAGALE